MNTIKTFAKFLDQPILISKLDKTMPKIMLMALTSKVAFDSFENHKKNKNATKEEKLENNKNLFKKSFVMASAVVSAINAPKIAGFVAKRQPIEKLDKVKEKMTKITDEFIKNKNPDSTTTKILNKSKQKALSFREVRGLNENLKKIDGGEDFFKKLIPEPENIKSKDIFSEIGYLSVYGAVPVIGGIAGGVLGDVLSSDNCKKNLPDKISEGIYQYLANIFMCNIGAAAALKLLEKANITSKSARALGMIAGIVLTGVVGGSKIANCISNKFINPLIDKNKKIKERKPEPLDLCMHTDDIATVSVLSGLKWIEPSLPILYSVSGYKAGIGYRN